MSKACAKTILFGEHAVVYGEPGIAVPISSLYTSVELTDSDKNILETDWVLDKEQEKKLNHLIDFLKINNKKIRINSNIPLSSGLGSSASLSVALIRTMQPDWSNEKVNELAYECEKIFHGTPSGIDNSVVTYEKPIYYHNGKIDFITIKPLKFLIVNSGVKSSTKEVLMQVKHNYENNKEKYSKVMYEIGYLVKKAHSELEFGNTKLIGFLMIRNHELLRGLGVSCDELDMIVKSALEYGAYGAKMVGGGKGGNAIVLVDKNNIESVKNKLSRHYKNIIEVDI